MPSTPFAGETSAEVQLFPVMDFSVTLPDELFAIDFATISLEEMPDVLERKLGPEAGRALNDRLQQTQYQQFVRTGGLKLFVIDTSVARPRGTENVNFIVIPAPASLTQTAMLSANLSELQRLNVAVVKQDVFEANGITFDVLRCRFRETELDFLQYVTLTSGKSCIITFTARRDRADSLVARAKVVMASSIPKGRRGSDVAKAGCFDSPRLHALTILLIADPSSFEAETLPKPASALSMTNPRSRSVVNAVRIVWLTSVVSSARVCALRGSRRLSCPTPG